MTIICCDMCFKPLKSARFRISTVLRPNHFLTVGPECFRKEKKARVRLMAEKTPQEIEALRQKIALIDASAK